MSDFMREERFIVIKRKHLSIRTEDDLRGWLRRNNIQTVECVVVESDWPEYESVWRMIENRVEAGRANEPINRYWVATQALIDKEWVGIQGLVVDAANHDRVVQGLNDRHVAQCETTGRIADERDTLRAEVERLRAALEKIANETAATWVCDAANAALAGGKEGK